MRVFMLGWEFPPFITGGLGTACHGLTRALDGRGVEVIFALPKAIEAGVASHVSLISPELLPVDVESAPKPGVPEAGGDQSEAPIAAGPEPASEGRRADGFQRLSFLEVPIVVQSSYASPGPGTVTSEPIATELPDGSKRAAKGQPVRAASTASSTVREVLPESSHLPPPDEASDEAPGKATDYGGDLMTQVQRYAHFCAKAAKRTEFDVIHAHDWLTYAAGMAVARLGGKPLIVHVHSTEFDRSGEHINQQVYDIERRGMHAAMRVVTVSQLTKNTVVHRYGVPADKVEVVYNGVELEPTQPDRIGIGRDEKIVLYFGRITMQKGPEYFIRAARRVLDHTSDVKFVVAGSGDMASNMIEMAAGLGIGHKVLFTGFLRGADIQRVFALADVYVMPSVSEPFGIAPLEAMGHDVPVIISKSSGVSEVLTHALKVDFWDIDDMADKIIAVLRHPPLSRSLRQHGAFEVRRLTWDGAAERCERIYRDAGRSLLGTR